MQALDVVAIALVLLAAAAFALGSASLAHAEDLKAFYWLAVGIVAVRAAVQCGRPGGVA